MAHVSIGILARNEEDVIKSTLASLLTQTIFKTPDITSEVVVVPNGCTDNTAAISSSFLQSSEDCFNTKQVSWKVCEIEQPGLANAWNTFIHKLSSPSVDYLFVMSSDIELIEAETFHSMVNILEERPEAWVSVDKRIKDVAFKEHKTIADHLSVWVSKISGARFTEGEPAWISGQLSCTRAHVLRKVWLPITLPTDDSFFYTMVVTNFLTESPKPERVLLAPSAAHTFEAYTGIKRLFKHEKWLIFGAVVNDLLFSYLKNISKFSNQDVCVFIQHENENNPFWLNELIQKTTLNSQRWFIPRFIMVRRFQSLQAKPLLKAILLLPLSIVAFLIDAFLAFQVNTEMNRKGGLATWTDSGSWGKNDS